MAGRISVVARFSTRVGQRLRVLLTHLGDVTLGAQGHVLRFTAAVLSVPTLLHHVKAHSEATCTVLAKEAVALRVATALGESEAVIQERLGALMPDPNLTLAALANLTDLVALDSSAEAEAWFKYLTLFEVRPLWSPCVPAFPCFATWLRSFGVVSATR